ncbi:MAG TPA: hypothetical protein VHM24_13765, partial [Gemmatimonadaceae bacterium]|nr:hypothetical protein [Gemmatimonadaceae bacterium]
IGMLSSLAQARVIRLCMDCISSLGAIPVDLRGVHLATGVSGKAFGAPPGISLVFHNEDIRPSFALPRYLDLGLYAETPGAPFTQSSNLLRALRAAVVGIEKSHLPSPAVTQDAVWLRQQLRASGFEILADDEHTSPAVTTIALPYDVSSEELGIRLEEDGFATSYRSEYLRKRNWIQVCLMGNYRRDCLGPLVSALTDLAERRPLAS